MLRKEIGEYYRLAAEARERASAHADPVIRQEFLDMEQRWAPFGPPTYDFKAPEGLHRRQAARWQTRLGKYVAGDGARRWTAVSLRKFDCATVNRMNC